MDSLYICEDLLYEIMSWLPPESLMRFKGVNKHWYTLINQLTRDPKFVAKHLKNLDRNIFSPALFLCLSLSFQKESTFDIKEQLSLLALAPKNHIESLNYIPSVVKDLLSIPCDKKPSYTWLSHCNGIVSLAANLGFKLWNPALREVKFVPKPRLVHDPLPLGMGFGHDPRSDDYKIVIIPSSFNNVSDSAQVYSLNSGRWREIETSVTCTEPLLTDVYCNGFCYWLTDCGEDDIDTTMFCFDLSNEEFDIEDLPDGFWHMPVQQLKLAVVNDCVALLCHDCWTDDTRVKHMGIEVWIKEGCDWQKYADVDPIPGIVTGLVFWTSDELLVQRADGELLAYNHLKEKFRHVVNLGRNLISYMACPYVKSLVSVVKRKQARLSA